MVCGMPRLYSLDILGLNLTQRQDAANFMTSITEEQDLGDDDLLCQQLGLPEKGVSLVKMEGRVFLRIAGEVKAEGLTVPLITGSGTGTLVHEAASGVFGELQAGSFMFMDADYARNEREPAQPAFEHALFVKTQVVSVRDTHAVCDAGHKSHAIDSGLPTVALLPPGHALRYGNGGDEHGLLYADGPEARLPTLGRMLWLIPGHCDPTVNLH
eukprot:gene33973-56669_t